MSLFALASGTLIADPQRRAGTKATFGTATLRVAADDAEKILVSIIAFGTDGERLLEYSKGDALAVSGRGRLTSWTGRDGAQKYCISIIVEQIAAAKPAPRPRASPRSAAPRKRARHQQTSFPLGHGSPLPDDDVAGLWREAALVR